MFCARQNKKKQKLAHVDGWGRRLFNTKEYIFFFEKRHTNFYYDDTLRNQKMYT